MAVESVGNVGGVNAPQKASGGAGFEAALSDAWKNEWTRREQARDQAKASGNEALAQHYQNELDVMKPVMQAVAPTSATPPAAEPGVVPASADSAQPAPAPAPQSEQPLPATPPVTQAATKPPSDAASGNTLNFTNKRDTPMTVVFTGNAGQPAMAPITLKPGETLTQSFPEGWSGNFRTTDAGGANVTLGEVKFNGGADGKQTFYDVSYIEGNNARMTIEPEGGGPVSGTLKDIVSGAPDSIKARDANGNVYGLKKTTNAEAIDESVVNYYRTVVGEGEGYVVPKDDASTRGTNSSNLNVQIA